MHQLVTQDVVGFGESAGKRQDDPPFDRLGDPTGALAPFVLHLVAAEVLGIGGTRQRHGAEQSEQQGQSRIHARFLFQQFGHFRYQGHGSQTWQMADAGSRFEGRLMSRFANRNRKFPRNLQSYFCIHDSLARTWRAVSTG
jgi:hypothetical protein